jgi:putative holliday junction resolvase
MKGEATASADAAIAFAQGVAEITNLEVELWDERLSTVEAQRQLHASGLNAKQSRGKIDSAAACVVLQAWMESQHTRARSAGDALGGPGAPPASAGRANERGARRSR